MFFNKVNLLPQKSLWASSAMTSITWSNDVDPIKTTISVFQNQWRLLPLRSKFRHLSSHKLIGRSLEIILNLCTVLKTHEPVHVKHGKCIFVPQGEYSRIRTINLNLMMQKGRRVVQMIIAHKSFLIIYIFKR